MCNEIRKRNKKAQSLLTAHWCTCEIAVFRERGLHITILAAASTFNLKNLSKRNAKMPQLRPLLLTLGI